MKAKKLSLQVTDLCADLAPEIKAPFETIAASPRERSKGLLLVWDWRDVAVRYLQRKFPDGWIYRGGRHVAVHASPPKGGMWTKQGGRIERNEAGRLLGRIIELKPSGGSY